VSWAAAPDTGTGDADDAERRDADSIFGDGLFWFTLKETEFYSLKRVEMKIKPSE